MTGSGSALDPHLSVATAIWQVPRIAIWERISGGDIIDEVVAGLPEVDVLVIGLGESD